MQLDIFAEFEIELSEETENEDIGCGGGGAIERSKLGPFGLLVIADETLSELTPIYFRPQNNSTDNNIYFCADETRFGLNLVELSIVYLLYIHNFVV